MLCLPLEDVGVFSRTSSPFCAPFDASLVVGLVRVMGMLGRPVSFDSVFSE